MEPQTARYMYNQYSRAESSKMASMGTTSNLAAGKETTEVSRTRHSPSALLRVGGNGGRALGTKWLLSLGSIGTKATVNLRFRPTVIIIVILFIVVVVIIVAPLAMFSKL